MIGALASCNLDEVYYSQTTPDNFIENEVYHNQLLTRPMNHWAYVVNEYMVEVNEESADCSYGRHARPVTAMTARTVLTCVTTP